MIDNPAAFAFGGLTTLEAMKQQKEQLLLEQQQRIFDQNAQDQSTPKTKKKGNRKRLRWADIEKQVSSQILMEFYNTPEYRKIMRETMKPFYSEELLTEYYGPA